MGARYIARPQLVALLLAMAVFLPPIVVPMYPTGGNTMVLAAHHKFIPRFAFPSGGRRLFPSYRLVALYGTPGTPELGALGEQDVQAAIARVKALAASYQPLVREHVYPTLEIIATVASSTPTDDGDYSYAIDPNVVRQWVAAAKEQGAYVVLDLQPGRTDFLTQARQYEDVLRQPNVGLALDPEWRLAPQQVPLVQIGSVNIQEVNATLQWLAALTAEHKLPQKIFLLHQFMLSMLPGREQLDTTHKELAYAIQMDGQGSQPAKLDTWRALLVNPPANVYFGWKNFYKKDTPMLSPEDTVKISPIPWYISYQ